MRLLYLLKRKTLCIHWSIHPLLCLCNCLSICKIAESIAKSGEINCTSIFQFNGNKFWNSIHKMKKILKRKLHVHSRIVVCTNLSFWAHLVIPIFFLLKYTNASFAQVGMLGGTIFFFIDFNKIIVGVRPFRVPRGGSTNTWAELSTFGIKRYMAWKTWNCFTKTNI